MEICEGKRGVEKCDGLVGTLQGRTKLQNFTNLLVKHGKLLGLILNGHPQTFSLREPSQRPMTGLPGVPKEEVRPMPCPGKWELERIQAPGERKRQWQWGEDIFELSGKR